MKILNELVMENITGDEPTTVKGKLERYHLHNMASEVFAALGQQANSDMHSRKASDYHAEAHAQHRNAPEERGYWVDPDAATADFTYHKKKAKQNVHQKITDRLL